MATEITTIGVAMETDGVERGIRTLKTLAEQGPKVEKAMGGVASAAKTANAGLRGVGDGASKGLDDVARSAPRAEGALGRVAKSAKDAKAAIGEISQAGAGLGRVAQSSQQAATGLQSISTQAALAGNAFSALSVGVTAVAGSALIGWATEASKALFQASAAAERLKIGLDFASARGGAAEIEYLRNVTDKLGLAFYDTAKAYQQFQAASRGTALEGDKARQVFEAVSKASAVMGLSADQASGALLALQQMVSKGVVQSEELRGQLGERLPGAFQIAARAMGVTTAELGKMLEQGQVVADDFLPKFARQLEQELGGSAEKAADRLDASVNRINNSWDRLKQNVGDSGVSQFWAGQLNILNDALANYNTRVEAARASGDGFFGQLAAGAGAALQFVNPINAISYSALDAGNQLKEAEKNLADLAARGAEKSSNLMLREAYNHAERLVNKLREAQRAQQALANANIVYTEGMGNSQAIIGQRNALEATVKSALEATKGYQSLGEKMAAVSKDGDKARAALKELEKQGEGNSENANKLRERIKGVDEQLAKMAKSGTTTARAMDTSQSAYKSLADQINNYVNQLKIEIQQGNKVTTSQRLQLQLNQLLATSKNKLKNADVASLKAAIATAAALERDAKAAQDAAAAYEDAATFRAEWHAAQGKVSEELAKGNDRMREEIALIGLSEEAQEALNRQRIEAQLLVKEQHLAELQRANDLVGFESREQAALQDQIQLLRERLALLDDKSVRTANARAAKKMADDWDKTAETIGDTLADYIMGGGKDAAQYLKRLFSTLVLQPVVQTVVGDILGFGGGSAGVAGAAGGGGVFGVLNGASNLRTLYSGLTGGFASSLGAGIASLGSTFGSAAITAFGNGMAMTAAQAAAAAQAYTAAGAAYAPIAGALSGGASTGAMLTKATGWGAAAIALAAAFGAFRKTKVVDTGIMGTLGVEGGIHDFTQKRKDGSLFSGPKYTLVDEGVSSFDKPMQDAFKALWGAAIDMGKILGLATDNLKDFTTAITLDSADSASGTRGLNLKGLSEEEVQKKIQLALDTANNEMAQQLIGSLEEVTTIVKGKTVGPFRISASKQVTTSVYTPSEYAMEGEKAIETLTRLASSLGTVNPALKDLNLALYEGSLAGADMAYKLSTLFGGLEGFTTATSSFYQNFFSEEEKRAKLQEKLSDAFSSINLTLPDIDASNAREQYRALADAQDLATESGREAWAVIMQLGDAFASITPSIEDAAAAMAAESERAAQAMQDAAAAMAEMRREATGIVDAQAQSLQSLIDGLKRQEQQVSGGYLGDLLLSGSEFTQFSGFADQLDGATDALAELESLGLGDELKGYADQIGAIVQQTKEALAGALSAQRLMAGDAAGALAAAISASMPQYSDFTTDGNFNAGAFNAALWTEKAKAASGLISGASANALSVPGAGGVLGTLMGDITTYGREVVLRDLRASGAEYLGPLISGMFTGVYDVLAAKAETAMISGPGLASVMAARRQFGGVQAEFDAFAKSFEAVQGSLKLGRISAEEAEKAIGYLTESFGDLTPLLSDAAAQAARVASAALDLSAAGMASVDYYFGSLTDIVQGFSEAAAKANAPLAEATRAIGLLDSMTAAFGQSASAALEGSRAAVDGYLQAAQAAREQGDWDASWAYSSQAAQVQLSLDGLAAVDSRVSKAQMIADAAAMASGIMTTASAAKAAEELAGKLVLGEGQSMRDLSLLVNGVSKYDNQAFYEAFARISDALGSGSISNEQYKTLFDYALGTYQGVSDEAKATASAFERLRDSMKSFADGLLIGDNTTLSAGATLKEMQRQYAEAFRLAAGGDTEAVSTYQQLANGLLDKSLYSTQAEYNVAFGRTYGDARALEAQGVNMLTAQQNGVVTELKALNASLSKRVEDMEKNLTAALAQIAKNTADTSRGVEVLALETP